MELQKTHTRYATDEDVVVVAISVDSDKSKVAPFIAKHEYSFPVLLGDGRIEEPYGTSAIPQTYIIDGTGTIRFHDTGFRTRYFQESMDWMVEAAQR